MPTWTWTDFDTVEIQFGNLADIRAYEPPEGCPMPESEKLANYLMRLLDTMNSGEFRLARPIMTDQVCTAKNAVYWLNGICSKLSNIEELENGRNFVLENLKNGVTDNLFSLASNADKAIIDFSLIKINFDSLLEKFVLLQADISAVKLQIDKLYIDELNVTGDISVNQAILEKAFLLADKETPILGRALLQSDAGQGENSSVLKNGLCFFEPTEATLSLGVAERVGVKLVADEETQELSKISRLAEIEEELVSIEASDKVTEIGSDAYYLKSKVVRS
jgi:hypothetical protein